MVWKSDFRVLVAANYQPATSLGGWCRACSTQTLVGDAGTWREVGSLPGPDGEKVKSIQVGVEIEPVQPVL